MRRIRTSLRLSAAALALTTVVGTVVAGVSLSGVDPASAAPGDRPNVIMVVTDDQRHDSFDKRTMPATKKLIAGRGTTFTDAIITTPTCCPSRATMLTGQYGHNNGVVANAPGYRALEDPENTLPVWLNEAGYQTAHLGKYLNGYQGAVETRTEVAPGWDEWYTMLTPRQYYGYDLAVNGGSEKFGNKDGDHLTRVLNRQTARLIRRFSGKDAPFYIQLDQFAPHTESGASKGATRCKGGAVPDPRDDELFEDVRPRETPNFNEKDVSDKPSFIRDRDRLDATGKKKVAKRLGCRLASLRAVDRGVKKIVRTLKKEKALDETVIIFVSDNGYFQGEHRISVNKTFPYEEALRVPLAIRVPPGVAGGDGAGKVKELVSNVDLAPTILDLAGAEPCTDTGCRVMDGRSMAPLLRGNGGGFSDSRSLVLEYGRERDKTGLLCEYAGIRTSQHSYVEYTGLASNGGCDPIDERELYPLGPDPFQLDNLATGNGKSSLQRELEDKLAELSDCAGIEGRDPAPPAGSHCE
jgi:N-acetylglucosamine-6-sulfatase